MERRQATRCVAAGGMETLRTRVRKGDLQNPLITMTLGCRWAHVVTGSNRRPSR